MEEVISIILQLLLRQLADVLRPVGILVKPQHIHCGGVGGGVVVVVVVGVVVGVVGVLLCPTTTITREHVAVLAGHSQLVLMDAGFGVIIFFFFLVVEGGVEV